MTPSQLNVLREAAHADMPSGSMSLPPQTVVTLCDEVEQLGKDAERLEWLLGYLVSPRTDLDDLICEAADEGVMQIKNVIDKQLKQT